MASSAPAVKFTYADYRNAPDDRRYELLDGDLVVSPGPSTVHQRASINLVLLLGQATIVSGIGEVFAAPLDVVLSETDVVQPDLLFITNDRAHIITDENVRGAPDLVVEILSPSTAERDRTYKRALYAKFGVKEYWLVDPEAHSVTILLLGPQGFEELGVCGPGETLDSPTLQGFAVSPDAIFTR